ncbi:MAG: hypothetical protein DCO96_13930 [Fluviicola sp. XM-24bin1]|nr:MAG: hypothetical protein DCO96_13930 [Fluviicola sp. XM-24bin1]
MVKSKALRKKEMKYEERVPDALFREEDGQYLGRPADFNDRIISRRVNIVANTEGFVQKDAHLLDIGCGNGASMFLLCDKVSQCMGIDINDDHEEELKNYAAQHGIKNVDFEIVDVVAEEPKKQYDRIISFEVIEHLSAEDGVAYYHKALKDDGIMAISVPNKWWIFETHGAKLPLLPWNRVPFFSWLPKPIHEKYANARIYTKRRIIKLLEKHNFSVEETHYVTAPMDVLPDGKFKKWVIRNFFDKDTTRNPCKAVSIIVIAKKK